MLSRFERNGEWLTIEARYDSDTSEFIVLVRYPDGREQIERFTDGDQYGEWLDTRERTLEQEHWTRHSGDLDRRRP